jgi:hypothetical protein
MRRLLVTLAIALTSIGLASPALAAPTQRMIPTGSLFSVLAQSATVTSSSFSTSISIPGASPLVWFADRPARAAGTGTAAGLVANWKRLGFAAVPPNAALVSTRDGMAMQQAVKLSRPRAEGSLVTFTVTPLRTAVLGMRTTTPLTPGQYGGVSIFIDPSGGGQTPNYLVCDSPDGDKARAFYQIRPVRIFPNLLTVARAPAVVVDFDDAAGLAKYGFQVIEGQFTCTTG